MSRPSSPLPFRLRRILPWVLALVVGVAAIVAVMMPRPADSSPSLVGTALGDKPAPPFRLRDQFGQTVTLRQFRGRPVIVTFMQATCTKLCPTTAETIHRAVTELGAAGKQPAIVAISADPEHDTPAAVKRFSQAHGLYYRWLYLTGTRRVLTPIWRSYYLYVAPANAPASVRESHTSATYLIDQQGRERVVMGGDPDTAGLQRDLLILQGLPVKPVGDFRFPAPQVDHPAPAFSLPALDGGTVSLSSLRGKTVLLNFWATWCHPCRQETPRLEGWYRKLGARGLVIIGVDQGEWPDQVAAFVQRYGLTYPIALDTQNAVGARYDVAGLPRSVLIAPDGTVAAVTLGGVDQSFLSAHVEPLLALPARK